MDSRFRGDKLRGNDRQNVGEFEKMAVKAAEK